MGKKEVFTIVVERDPESEWLVGEVVELPGCYSQAPDLPSLEKNMREAIRAYLRTMEHDPDELRPRFVGTWQVEVAAIIPVTCIPGSAPLPSNWLQFERTVSL